MSHMFNHGGILKIDWFSETLKKKGEVNWMISQEISHETIYEIF